MKIKRIENPTSSFTSKINTSINYYECILFIILVSLKLKLETWAKECFNGTIPFLSLRQEFV